jgi:hypothetical protein
MTRTQGRFGNAMGIERNNRIGRRTAGAASVALAAACLAPAADLGAAEVTAYLRDGVVHGTLPAGAGLRGKLGDRELRADDILGLDVDSASPRMPDAGVRLADGAFLVGRFPDFTAGRENGFESESFGPFAVAADQVSAVYVGGPPGRHPGTEASAAPGFVMQDGEFVAGEVLYVATRYAGLRVDGRIRKIGLSAVYAAILRPVSAAGAGAAPWRVRTLNGDVLHGEASEEGFRLQVPGGTRALAPDRLASARRRALDLLPAAKPAGPGPARPFRNGEGLPLQIATQRLLPDGLWQHAEASLALAPPAGSKALVFRAWREPGFFKGQIAVRFVAGAETLKEIVLNPAAGVLEGAVPLPAGATEVRALAQPGGDGAYGDRIVWEALVAAP